MENGTKALYIAASVLVAVLILSLVVFVFERIGDTQKAREKVREEYNISEFNAEYEVFNKKLMYGADVISCINKAISNNKDAQVAKDPEAYIDVDVTLDVPLKEEFRIYKIVRGKTKIIDTDDEDDIKNVKLKLYDLGAMSVQDIFKTNSNILTNNNTRTLGALGLCTTSTSWKDNVEATVLDKGNYKLLNAGKIPNDTKDDNPLGYLVNTKEELTYKFTSGDDNYYCIVWTTVFKNFRKKPFTCEGIEYNTDTGRIKKLIFKGKTK